MPKKISKILSHAKNRLSGKKHGSRGSLKSESDNISIHATGSTTDSSRLLNNYDDDDLDGPSGKNFEQDYDDFESPDLNFNSSEQSNTKTGSTIRVDDLKRNTTESIQGQPRQILKSLLSFGQSVDRTPSSEYGIMNDEEKEYNQKYWWQSDFLVSSNGKDPVFFGTWNGVFVTTVVHLFGVISFLRIGWMVGIEGVPVSMGIVFGCLLFNAISLLAAIGIMERCAAATTSGFGPFHHSTTSTRDINNRFDPEYTHTTASARANVHILIATVLGSRIGGAISLVYCIGQAVSCSLHVTGFSETFVHLCAVFIEQQLANSTELSTSSSSSLSNDTLWIHSETIAMSPSPSFARTLAKLLHIQIEYISVSSSTSASVESANNQIQLVLTPETFQIVSIGLILLLFLFNIVGVRWLFRLQTILFLSLVLAISDFFVGLFQRHSNFGYGEIKFSKEHFLQNLYPDSLPEPNEWKFWSQLFETIGIFFPATIGVMAGVNMGSDLERPAKSIPIGSLGAILSSYVIHLLFIIGLAFTCTRIALLNDYSIAQHVSALGVFFALGLYMSTISSSLGSMYTAPRIMQNLAQELHSVPVVRCFANGRGPNNIPINALILFTLVTICFVLIGGINILAPIVTIPYLLTYAAIEYAYFSMAMTFDIQIQREKRFMQIASQLKPSDSAADLRQPDTKQQINNDNLEIEPNSTIATNLIKSKPKSEDTVSLSPLIGCGTNNENGNQSQGTLSPSPSLQQQHLAGYGSIQSITQHIKIKRRQSTKSSDSDEEKEKDEDGDTFSRKLKRSSLDTSKSASTCSLNKKICSKPTKSIRQLMAAVSNSDDDDDEDLEDEIEITKPSSNDNEKNTLQVKMDNIDEALSSDYEQSLNVQQSERLLMPDLELAEIACKQQVWYLRLMNRWIVLIAAILKIVLMFVIEWHYALITIAIFAILYSIIGRTNPGFYPGVSEFYFFTWFRNCLCRLKFWGSSYSNLLNSRQSMDGKNMVASFSYDRIVLPETTIQYESDQLTKHGRDYEDREPCHSFTTIN